MSKVYLSCDNSYFLTFSDDGKNFTGVRVINQIHFISNVLHKGHDERNPGRMKLEDTQLMFAAACRLFCHCPQNVGKGDRSVLQFSNTLGLQWGKEKNVWVRFEPYPEYLNHSTKPTAQTHRF